MGMTLGLGSILLLPVAVLVQLFLPDLGVRIYAIVFLVSGIAGVIEIVVLRQLAKPGRVRVAQPGAGDAPPPVALAPASRHSCARSCIAAFGAGFGPYLSIYAISVLHLPPASRSCCRPSRRRRRSSRRPWSADCSPGAAPRERCGPRSSCAARLDAPGPDGLPQNPLAGLIICVVAAVAAAGASAGTLSSNERLMRLTPGPDLIRAQGSFVAGSAVRGSPSGSSRTPAILAILPLGYPAFAILFAVSGLTRFWTAARAEVSEPLVFEHPVYRNEDLRKP